MAGIFDITFTDEQGNVLPGRSLALVRPGTGGAVQLYADLDGTTPLAGNVVVTNAKGFAQAFCEGAVQVRDAQTGAVVHERLDVAPYTPPEDLPLSAASRDALAKVAGWPKGSLRAVIFGSSTDQRCHRAIMADFVINNEVATLTCRIDHNMLTGGRVSVGLSDPTTAPEDWRTTGTVTRVSARVLTLPAPGRPNGAGTTTVKLLHCLAAPSYWRAMNQALGGALELVANHAQGGETTPRKLAEYEEIDAFEPDIVVGAFGFPNDILQGVEAGAPERLQEMVRHFTSKGVYVLLTLPPAIPTLSAARMTAAMPGIEWALKERGRNARFLLLDEMPLTINRATGQGRPELFQNPTDVHSNRVYADIKGKAMAEVLRPMLRGGMPDHRVKSPLDRASANADSLQLVDGLWAGGAQLDASTLASKASGQVDAGFVEVTTGGTSGRRVVCSVVARPEGYGTLQRFVITGAAGDQFRFRYAGPSSARTAAAVQAKLAQPGRYEASAGLKMTQSAPAVLRHYRHFMEATVDGINAELSHHLGLDEGVIDPPPFALELLDDPALFPPFELPAGTAAVTKMDFVLEVELNAAGDVTLDWWLPTLRKRVGG